MNMCRPRISAVVLAATSLTAGGGAATAGDYARTAPEEGDDAAWEPPVRVSAGLLAGTGYGWASGTGDVNADIPFSGASWAQLGHMIPELTLLFPRARLFASASVRYQTITGTTDVYTPNQVFHARRSAWALFQKLGWFPRAPEARLQPYVSFAIGRGAIAHAARLPPQNCGPANDQRCVDTVTLGPWFVGAGAGLRARLADHLDALLALDAQLGYELPLDHRGYNLDLNVGMAAVF